MELSPNLYVVTDVQKIAIVKTLGKSWSEFEEIFDDFKRWIEHSKFANLSFARTENLAHFLLNSKLDMEKAKKNIENYCKARASYPDFYKKLIPGTDFFETAAKFGKVIRMPFLTPELASVSIYKIDDILGDAPDATYYYITTVMLVEAAMNRAYFTSHVVIVDLSGFTWKCFVKYTPHLNFMIMKIMNAFNMRVSQIHVINAPPFMNKVLYFTKFILTEKLFARIRIHDTLATLYKHLPKNCLPSDYGGSQRSYEEIYGDWIRELHLHKDYFEKAATEEYPAQDKFLFSEIIEGAPSGTFKSLVVD